MSPLRLAHRIDRGLIGLFALSSGLYKLSFGEADVEIFAHLHMSAVGTAGFGLLQLLCGLGLVRSETRAPAAVGLMACNLWATSALFAADIQPFGWVSFVMVAMAAAQILPEPTATKA